MDINNLTIGQVKELTAMFAGQTSETLAPKSGLMGMVGKLCVVRTYSAGVWFGEVVEKDRNEVILKDARRMWYWKAAESISLSAVALHGISEMESRICEAVPLVWLEAIELIPASETAIKCIKSAKITEAK